MTIVWFFLVFMVGAWFGVLIMACLAAGREPECVYIGDPSDRYDEGAVSDYILGRDDLGNEFLVPVSDPSGPAPSTGATRLPGPAPTGPDQTSP